MKTLVIPFLPNVGYRSDEKSVMDALAPLTAVTLEEAPWPQYPDKPVVHMKAVHTGDSLILQFSVEEKYIKAEYRNTNDPVHRDSCVECFIAFDNRHYYNLEFNCIGTAFAGYGSADKSTRRTLPKSTVERIRTYAVINPDKEKHQPVSWRLLLNIPLTVFEASGIRSLSEISCTGNFYKCGDGLPEPHFLAWSPIAYPEPNFHRPESFGKLFFL